MTNWKINSLDSLSLFDQVELTKEQVGVLPTGLIRQIKAGYGRALDRLFPEKLEGCHSLSFSTNLEGRIIVCLDGVERSAGSLNDDMDLRSALRSAYDIAMTLFFKAVDDVRYPGLRLHAPAKQTFCERAYDEVHMSVTNDVNSLVRRPLTIANVATKAVAGLTLAGGIGAMYVGGKILYNEMGAYHLASRVGDAEGKTVAKIRMTLGANLMGIGYSTVFTPFMAASQAATIGFGILAPIGMVGMAAAMLTQVYNCWTPQSDFRDSLAVVLKSEDKAERGLEFLQSQYTLTAGEFAELSDRFTGDALGKAIENKIQAKWGALVRRVGEPMAKRIVRETPALIEKGDVTGAIDLLKEVDTASFTVRMKQILYMILAAFYITLAVLGTIAMFTPVAPLAALVLGLISIVGWLMLDSERAGRWTGKAIYKVKNLAIT